MKLVNRSVFFVTMLLLSCVLQAAPLFISGDGLPGAGFTGEFNFSSDGGFTQAGNVAITPHPLWEPNRTAPGQSGAVWVSHRNTGYDGVAQAANNTASPTAYFWEVFSLTTLTDIDVSVWADDTAKVVINGKTLIEPNFTQNICAAGPVGCESGDVFSVRISAADLRIGRNEFIVSAYQTGGDTFGVMYEASAVPEPGTYALIGLGLAGLRLVRQMRH